MVELVDNMADDRVLCENSDIINPIEHEINNELLPIEHEINNEPLDLSMKPILNSRLVPGSALRYTGTYTKKNVGGGVRKKMYNNQYLSMNDDINKLHNY